MYLLRNAKEHTLLQTISRVNRPYKSPSGKTYQYGYIVDFVDIEAEYDRTIELYLKELEEDFGPDGDESTLSGLIIGPEDINKKYLNYKKTLDGIVDSSNLEKFSTNLTYFNKETLLTIKKTLNGIKTCYTEFLLSRATKFAEQIDIAHIKKLLSEVQHRLGFINLKAQPANLLSIISNKEVVEIIYEFFKVKVTILDLSKLSETMKKLVDSEEYQKMIDIVEKIQTEIKNNKNRNQEAIVKLDELLKKIFAMLEISDLDDLASVNTELAKVLEEIRSINEENDRLAARFEGNYAFVKTYTDAIEIRPDLDKDDIIKVMDIIYLAVRDIQDSNILILQGRDNFTASVKKSTTAELLKRGLYTKLGLREWYTSLLNETYANMKLF
jgi:type I restriction enzyme R subunit